MTAVGGPWRVLILDSSADDPKWVLATVAIPTDVRPAVMEGRQHRDWPEVAQWVRDQVGRRVSLAPIAAMVWRIDEGARVEGTMSAGRYRTLGKRGGRREY